MGPGAASLVLLCWEGSGLRASPLSLVFGGPWQELLTEACSLAVMSAPPCSALVLGGSPWLFQVLVSLRPLPLHPHRLMQIRFWVKLASLFIASGRWRAAQVASRRQALGQAGPGWPLRACMLLHSCWPVKCRFQTIPLSCTPTPTPGAHCLRAR